MSFADDNPLLFASRHSRGASLSDYLEDRRQRAKRLVNSLDQDHFLNTSEDTLTEHTVAEFHVEPLDVYRDAMDREQTETYVDMSGSRDRYIRGFVGASAAPGVQIVVNLPYSGEPELWQFTPSTSTMNPPRGNVKATQPDGLGQLKLILECPSNHPPEKLKRTLDSELDKIEQWVGWQRPEVDEFNDSLPEFVQQVIGHRHTRIRQNDGIGKALGIPLKRREGTPQMRPLPMRRKLIRPLPPPPEGGFEPEPGISGELYEEVLSVVRHVGRTFESTPATYGVHDEEELRDILIANLNGLYKGDASGETFRRNGRTDIRIEDEDRAAFVAECGVWHGSSWLVAKCDQLLSYLTWRDCKAALIVINKKNRRFSDLLGKTPAALRNHPGFLRELHTAPEEGEWRMVFSSPQDEAREVTVHIFVLDLFTD